MNHLTNYEKSRDYLILQEWKKYFENQIKALTEIWNAYWNEKKVPSMPIKELEVKLNDNFTKRDYCENRIAAKLSPGPLLGSLIL